MTIAFRQLATLQLTRAMARRLWIAAALVAACALVAAVAWQRSQRVTYLEAEAEAEATAAARGLAQAPLGPASSPPAAPELDFAKRFGPDAGLALWARDVQRTAGQLGVSLLTVSNTVVSPQSDRLGRNDIQLLLRGTYPQIKLLLKETLSRHPNTSVVRLNMRSVSGAAEVEASVMLVRWSAPLPSDQAAPSRALSS
jgi:hypothetical protein